MLKLSDGYPTLTIKMPSDKRTACKSHKHNLNQIWYWKMVKKKIDVTSAVSPEERDVRTKLAKAMFFVEIGDAKPTDPKAAQSAFDEVKDQWIGKAIKTKKTLLDLDMS